ncbi:MAG: L,D-transpeptidase family protein [Proteobacteria bacterium]|nr:L,D-transpeptidase family protein [Pseudomonadota bacterium]
MTNSPADSEPSHRLFVLILILPVLAFLAACSGGASPDGLAKADGQYALQVLDHAPEQGFPKGAFDVGAIHAALDRRDEAQASALLRPAVIAYARAQHGVLIPAKSRPQAWGESAKPYDAATELDSALRAGRFRQWLDGQPPASPLYQALQKAYVATLAQAQTPQTTAYANTLRANLERLRWLPRDEPATRIDVNIASMSLIYIVDGQPRLTMRTASGKPGDETPILTSTIDHIVLNPPWNVPKGIAEKELLPKGEAYLAAHGFETKDDGGLVQTPGPQSALGLVKFDFDNPYAVYLHDTPSKAAFDRDGRAVSHGCVRLEHALDLANLLLATQPGWSPQRVQQVIDGGQTTTIPLSHPVPVRLFYLTAVPQDGRIVLTSDIYGWDAPMLQLLDKAALGVAS